MAAIGDGFHFGLGSFQSRAEPESDEVIPDDLPPWEWMVQNYPHFVASCQKCHQEELEMMARSSAKGNDGPLLSPSAPVGSVVFGGLPAPESGMQPHDVPKGGDGGEAPVFLMYKKFHPVFSFCLDLPIHYKNRRLPPSFENPYVQEARFLLRKHLLAAKPPGSPTVKASPTLIVDAPAAVGATECVAASTEVAQQAAKTKFLLYAMDRVQEDLLFALDPEMKFGLPVEEDIKEMKLDRLGLSVWKNHFMPLLMTPPKRMDSMVEWPKKRDAASGTSSALPSSAGKKAKSVDDDEAWIL
jgi:hypothetical protein